MQKLTGIKTSLPSKIGILKSNILIFTLIYLVNQIDKSFDRINIIYKIFSKKTPPKERTHLTNVKSKYLLALN
ncbi:MAG: hypothetical protein IPL26_12540 [Leptospiraceae bacterium]|nr:hypothetical protein [Leptospiraceae bacterium]